MKQVLFDDEANSMWMRLIHRTIQIRLQSLAVEEQVGIHIDSIELRKNENDISNPLGQLFARTDSGDIVPIVAFLPLRGCVFGPRGESLEVDQEDVSRLRELTPEMLGANDDLNSRFDRTMGALSMICDEWRVKLSGFLTFRGGFVGEVYVRSPSFEIIPSVPIKFSLSDNEDEDFKLLIGHHEIGLLGSNNKRFSIAVPRGFHRIGITRGDQYSVRIELDLTEPRSFNVGITQEDEIYVVDRGDFRASCSLGLAEPKVNAVKGLNEAAATLLSSRVDLADTSFGTPKVPIQDQGQDFDRRSRPMLKIPGDGGIVVTAGLVDGRWIGFVGQEYKKLVGYCEKLASRREWSGCVTPSYVERQFLHWVFEHHSLDRSSADAAPDFIETFVAAVANDVEDYEVSAPIVNLDLKKQIWIGTVSLGQFSPDYFDEAMNAHSDLSTAEEIERVAQIEELKHLYKGSVVARTTEWGVKEFAVDIGMDRIRRAMTLLTLYSPTAIDPFRQVHLGLKGEGHLPTNTYFVKGSDPSDVTVNSSLKVAPNWQWVIDGQERSRLRESGLYKASNLLSATLSDFQKRLLRSIEIFVHGLRHVAYSDRLVFSLSSLETLLLGGDKSVPIIHTVGNRLAHLVASTPFHRKRVISDLRDSHSHRGNYIHHGEHAESVEAERVLRHLQQHCLMAMRISMSLSDHIESAEEFVQMLDDQMLA